MSSLQRSAMSARIAKLPRLPYGIAPSVAQSSLHDEDDVAEEESDDLGALPSTATTLNQYLIFYLLTNVSVNISNFLFFIQINPI